MTLGNGTGIIFNRKATGGKVKFGEGGRDILSRGWTWIKAIAHGKWMITARRMQYWFA